MEELQRIDTAFQSILAAVRNNLATPDIILNTLAHVYVDFSIMTGDFTSDVWLQSTNDDDVTNFLSNLSQTRSSDKLKFIYANFCYIISTMVSDYQDCNYVSIQEKAKDVQAIVACMTRSSFVH